MMVARSDIQLVQTCYACPEQYDAVLGSSTIGYLRLRHGRFTVQYPDPTGPVVYQADTIGDGLFDPSEREHHLDAAKGALVVALTIAKHIRVTGSLLTNPPTT
jgi:hypothetical protein